LKPCSIVCDTPAGLKSCELQTSDEATIDDALALARIALGDSAADWEHAAIGIYGRIRPRNFVFAAGDRIELYRPLQLDPRARRRERAKR
jgi:putative ubiquitin-RnfH superfamily antitoxin RatB of RatAB toxin-antitoxin module